MTILGSAVPLPGPERLAWLAGFVDGEGTISLTRSPNGRTLRAVFTLPNTNLRNIHRAEALVSAIIGHRLRIRKDGNTSMGYRPCYSLAVSSHADLEMLLTAIAPYCVGKWRHVDLMLEYLRIAPGSQNRSYLDRLYGRDPADRPRRYDARHYEMARQMRALNRRFGKNEWKPADDPLFDEPPPRSPAAFIGDSDEALKQLFMRRIG